MGISTLSLYLFIRNIPFLTRWYGDSGTNIMAITNISGKISKIAANSLQCNDIPITLVRRIPAHMES